MKLRFISLFIATAAILSACCGVFYAQNFKDEATGTESYVDSDFTFSLDTAKSALHLCAIAGYPVSLSAELEISDFKNIEYFQYENGEKSDNKAGLVLCHKEDFLLAIIRGTKDEEWYSNFYIGEGFEHAGFSKAADLVLINIDGYCRRHNIDKKSTEIFVTGHSRGAAVANLAGARLTDQSDFNKISAYTFACPNTTTSDNAYNLKYRSIINIINPQDFICYIPLPRWGYTRYGCTIELPDNTHPAFNELYAEMEKSYLKDTCTELKDFPNKGDDVKNIIDFLGDLAPTPEDYYQKEISVGGLSLTMYDYMMKLAAVMNDENPLLHGLFMLSCKSVPEVCPITDFVFSGLTEEELKSSSSIMDTAVVVNHMHEAYFAWLNTLKESYFTEKMP